MKHLINKVGDNFFIADTMTGNLHLYSVNEVLGSREKIHGIRKSASSVYVTPGYITLQGNKLYLLESLVEGSKVVGFVAYLRSNNQIVYIGTDRAVKIAEDYGVTRGELKYSTSGRGYIESKLPRVKATVHKQMYMDMYRERKQLAEGRGFSIKEKIVRSGIDTLEMRQIPPVVYDNYMAPRGVNVYNLKWWKLIGEQLYVLKRPKIKILDLSNYAVSIEYAGLPERLSGITIDGVHSLGSFAEWGLESVTFGNLLQKIGKEAFKCNKLRQLKLPKNVGRIEEEAFFGNLLTELLFMQGASLYHLGDRCFARNNLSMIVLPSSLEEMGEMCFADNPYLFSVEFEDIVGCKLKEIKPRTFASCDIGSILLPNSITRVAMDAFIGCEYFNCIKIFENSELNNSKFKSDWAAQGVTVEILRV